LFTLRNSTDTVPVAPSARPLPNPVIDCIYFTP
jgi:hypothetical protein